MKNINETDESNNEDNIIEDNNEDINNDDNNKDDTNKDYNNNDYNKNNDYNDNNDDNNNDDYIDNDVNNNEDNNIYEDNNNDEDINDEDNNKDIDENKYIDEDNNYDNTYNNNNDNNRNNNIRPVNKDKDKDIDSDTSSNYDSNIGNGEMLIQNKKVTEQPRNYTSQSFFIDKNNANNIVPSNYQINTHNTNQLPMTMKGDFVSLLEKNPKILARKNPRIQVTNATCDLNQIMNNENTEDELNSEEVNNEMDKLNKNFVIDKNKVLSKVIQNCDKDLYASQKPFKSKKDQWYSVSIPLNDNEAKWEFLNNIKGERDKNNLNKFELIQKHPEPLNEENELKERSPYNKRTLRTDKKNPNNKDNSYKLREMNYSQFYRSPIRTPKIPEDEKSLIGNRIRRPGERKNTQKSYLNNSRYNRNGRNNNFDRSRGKIEFDPKYRSIDYDNGYDIDSDE